LTEGELRASGVLRVGLDRSFSWAIEARDADEQALPERRASEGGTTAV